MQLFVVKIVIRKSNSNQISGVEIKNLCKFQNDECIKN